MKAPQQRKSDVIIILLVFCVFVFSILIVLSMSGIGYKNILNLTQKSHDEQIGLSFVWTKIKNGDELDRIYLTEFHDLPALYIDSEFDDIVFHTVIYHYDGWIREMFYEAGYALLPKDGFPIVKADDFRLEQLEQGLIRISIDDENLFISPRATSRILN